MSTLATTMRNYSTRFSRRFNQSFWCAVYNVACFVMMVVSVLLSGLVFVIVRTGQRLTGRVASVTKRSKQSDVLDLRHDGSGERSTVS
jgi:hypothetical protein